MYAHILRVFILAVIFNRISSETGCQSAKKCGQCISYAAERCVWCAAPIDEFQDVRCQPKILIDQNTTWCKGYIKDPVSVITTLKSEELRNGNDKVNAIQLKPQEIDIKVRPGVPVNFTFVYKPDKDYPLDVYYLMDFSYTMKEHFEKLKSQYRKIYTSLISFTNNVRLGLGSFVEKPGFPYVDTTIQDSYIFKNHISLTGNITEFERKIESAVYKNTSNYDDPEAILDALMQAIVCEEVNWRNDCTRIIVTSTDGTYHSAGDGKMLGAVIPHDMKCHNDRESALLYDYPSVSQMNKVASEKDVKIIFAVLDNVKNEYELLSKHIFSSEYAVLNTDTNIVNLITNAYVKSRNNVKLFSDFPDNIKIKFDPACDNTDNINCDIKHKGSITINVTLTATSCSPVQNFGIGVQGKTERLKIKMTVDCQCDCEKDDHGIHDSRNCNSQGLEQCGVCECNSGRYGELCQCNGTDTSKTDLYKCMKNNSETCSNRGECICGLCKCRSGYHGEFCEFNGQECSPPGTPQCAGHGKCKFGKCVCDVGWDVKEHCNCTRDIEHCMNPTSGKICSGNGICECGQCTCDTSAKNIAYSGTFCECTAKDCDALTEYVLCNFYNKKNQKGCSEEHKEYADIDFVNKTELNSQSLRLSTKFCKIDLKNRSFVDFRYHCRNLGLLQKLHVIIQDEPDTLPAPSIWIPLGSTIGAILLIGLLTIIAWKLLVDMYDAREYKKFEKEAIDAGFDVNVNPHYKEPQVNFTNPTFNKKL